MLRHTIRDWSVWRATLADLASEALVHASLGWFEAGGGAFTEPARIAVTPEARPWISSQPCHSSSSRPVRQ